MVDTQAQVVWSAYDSIQLPDGWHIAWIDATYHRCDGSKCIIAVTINDGRRLSVMGRGALPSSAWVDAVAEIDRQTRDWWFHHHLACGWRMHSVTAVFYERQDGTDDTGRGTVPSATATPHAGL